MTFENYEHKHMKKILLDTNIVLDIALNRDKFGENAGKLILFIVRNNINSYVTASSITDIYYVLRKEKGHATSIEFLKDFVQIVSIIGVDEKIIINALESRMKDFEDAVQVETAINNNIDVIITRDKRDYQDLELKVLSPVEYVEELQ